MRIVHAVRSDGYAGVEAHVARLARAQSAAGHRVVVVGGAARTGATAGAAVCHREAASTADVVRGLRATAGDADVVHVHMTAAEVAATLAGLTRRLPPVVSTRHFAGVRGHGPGARLTAAVARRHVVAQVAISAYVAAHVDGRSTVVHPGLDPRPDGPPAAAREPVVLVVQRLEPEKRTDVAVRAFAASGLAGHGWRLVVAGAGSQATELRGLAAGLGVGDAVDLLGARDDVEQLMTRAGVLLAPCPVEGLGLTVLEAMASGLPVVAADAGGHRETLAGLDPLALHPPLDAADAGERLAALAADPARRDTYAGAARARQRAAFTVDQQAAATDAVYRVATGAVPARRGAGRPAEETR